MVAPPWRPGVVEKIVGTNPWSFAARAGRYAPTVSDMASTGLARGKIYLARNRGEQIPEAWALDANGAPTTDPQAAIDGIILPVGGHKGYVISTLMDMMAGILSCRKAHFYQPSMALTNTIRRVVRDTF